MKSKKQYPWERFRFEFVLYINEQSKRENSTKKPIVCQRYFDVKDYNEDVLKSMELKELADSLTGMYSETMGLIPNYLKKISKRSCWREYNPYRVVELEDKNREMFNNEDVFTFEIKVDKRVVLKSSFSGNWLHTSFVQNEDEMRYEVNIKKIIPDIVKEIEYYFSKDNYKIPYGATA